LGAILLRGGEGGGEGRGEGRAGDGKWGGREWEGLKPPQSKFSGYVTSLVVGFDGSALLFCLCELNCY